MLFIACPLLFFLGKYLANLALMGTGFLLGLIFIYPTKWAWEYNAEILVKTAVDTAVDSGVKAVKTIGNAVTH